MTKSWHMFNSLAQLSFTKDVMLWMKLIVR